MDDINLVDLNRSFQPLEGYSTIFYANGGEEILKLCHNGDILVRGKLVENDKEVVDALREFLESQGFLKLKMVNSTDWKLDYQINPIF